ncbi:MAG: aryl-sulfate sulfotransferase [candidate division KSB1 bacterium]|nr:aryl-sulfate sulfotransferase [candidate division KSB1 bacterium]
MSRNLCFFSAVLMCLGWTIFLYPQENTVGLVTKESGSCPGYTLFAPLSATDTYLIDHDGNLVHSWTGDYSPGNSVYLLKDGSLLRTCDLQNSLFAAGGRGGAIRNLDWQSQVIWEYICSNDTICQHHDVEQLPNGNILVIAWEMKSRQDAIQAGCDSALVNHKGLWPDCILEIEPQGNNGGNIVWKWHVWDHLIQDFDPSKDNYGHISENPQLININYRSSTGIGADWNHTNSVDYNADLDQILLSVRAFSEIWVIDHSTTSEQAAGHTGGRCGRGGDLLYRWGNDATWDSHSASGQQLFYQHDAQWIDANLPGGGNILLFNNGKGRQPFAYSSIDELTPLLDTDDTYVKNTDSTFAPEDFTWTFTADPRKTFYADHISGTQRLTNGNTLICDGTHGTFFEVTENGQTVWKYINPVTNQGILSQGDSVFESGKDRVNNVFRAWRYPVDYPGLLGQDLIPTGPLEHARESQRDLYTRIPCNAASSDGLQVRVTAPETPRYQNGAPIAIYVAGGFDSEGLDERQTGLADEGFVEIRFNFPGGGKGGAKSGGEYDYRGPGSLLALRDIIQFAAQTRPDSSGLMLDDLLP